MNIRKLLTGFVILVAVGLLAAAALIFTYTQGGGLGGDAGTLARLIMFRYSLVKNLTPHETEALFGLSCVRKCHGKSVVEKAVHTTIGWAQTVDRMKKEHGASLTGPESAALTRYLQQTYPASQSTYPYEVVQKVFKMLWRSDVGEGDVYIDCIFATPEYFSSTGAIIQGEQFEVSNHLVFLINLTVHQGRLEPYQMDKLVYFRDETGKEHPALAEWNVLTETSDNHHRQGVVRFPRIDATGKPLLPEAARKFQLVIRNIANVKERVLEWQLPIPYPAEMSDKPKEELQ